MIRIIIADDHAIVRTGFRALLEQAGGYAIVDECGDADSARQALDKHCPDMLVLDISMPGGNGLELAAELRATHPNLRILLYSQHVNAMYVDEAQRLHLAGYVSKDAVADELVAALQAIGRGEFYLSRDLRRPLGNNGLGRLSEREREIFLQLAQGKTPKQISLDLGITDKTAYAHRDKIRDKLGIRNELQLQQLAQRMGLLR